MLINTKYHGEIEIDQENIIHFEHGIPSFEEEKKFTLLELGTDTPFIVLQSISTPALAFLVTDPFSFFPEYKVAIPDAVIEQLKIEEKETVATFGILTVKEPFEETTINLKGPIIINTKEKLGKQIVLNDIEYLTRHLIFKQKPSVGEER